MRIAPGAARMPGRRMAELLIKSKRLMKANPAILSILRQALVLLIIALSCGLAGAQAQDPNQGQSKSPAEDTSATTANASSSPGSSRTAKQAISKYIQIPLLYMTDRGIDQRRQFVNDRKEEAGSIHDVYCGNINYTLVNLEDKELTDKRIALGWQNKAKRSKMVHKLMPAPAQPSSALAEFGERLIEVADRSGQKDMVIFVHGFNTSFELAARCAAQLAYQTEHPVLLYSWPSRAKLLQYFVDSGNNEWSQEHFNRLLELLFDLKEKHALRPSIVAHSMGNRLVVRAAPVLQGKQLFHDVYLVDPDFDSQTFIHYVARYAHDKELKVGRKMRILFSHKDNALPVAQALFGGYTRLGQGVDTIAESIFNPRLMMPAAFNKTRAILSRKKVAATAAADDVLTNLFRKELDWIDFTTLDHGIIGHSIPYKLIAELGSTSGPGPDLEFAPVEVGVTDFAGKILGNFLGNKKVCRPLGTCRKVVKKQKRNLTAPGLAGSDDKQPDGPQSSLR
jgi:esterase/lipase superfamily enzyme